jgi:hypothetical protein
MSRYAPKLSITKPKPYCLQVYARALGFWTIWLFTIPSLRAVKPLGYPSVGMSAAVEKKALNLAFVLTPLLTLALPFATKVNPKP